MICVNGFASPPDQEHYTEKINRNGPLKAFEQIEYNTEPGPDYRSDDPKVDAMTGTLVHLIAYYLPQTFLAESHHKDPQQCFDKPVNFNLRVAQKNR